MFRCSYTRTIGTRQRPFGEPRDDGSDEVPAHAGAPEKNSGAANWAKQPTQGWFFVLYRLLRGTCVVLIAAWTLSFAVRSPATPAFAEAPAEYNCVNVVLRDAFWGQHRHIIQNGGNAADIAPAFERHGWIVNNSPSVGAIMVWPPNYHGAGSVGHTGVVVEVYGNGSVLVRHENWPYGSAEHTQVFANLPEYRYVHRPDAITLNAVYTEPGEEILESERQGSEAEEVMGAPHTEVTLSERRANGGFSPAQVVVSDLSPAVAELWKSDGRGKDRDRDEDKHRDRDKGRDRDKRKRRNRR